jgi:hypothetical protein
VLLGLAGLCAAAGAARADELRWTHFGLRPLAMGNAYVAVADDYNALFYNPAGLARLKEWSGELLNPAFEVSSNTVSGYNDLTSFLQSGSGSTTAALDLLAQYTGKTQHAALSLTPHLVFPGFGFGVGTDLEASIVAHREIAAQVDFGPTVIMPFAFAKNFLEDRLSLGASVKLVAKGGIDHEFSINDIKAFTSSATQNTEAAGQKTAKIGDYVQGGYGVGADLGMLFTPVKTMSPTIGVSITDLGGTTFKQANISGAALGAPKNRLPSVNTGVSLKPFEAGGMYLRTSIDADATNQPEHFSKKFNVGTEWGYGSIIKVDAGLHQGELAGGFSFDVFLLSIRFATYTEQLGTVAGEDDNLRDRRYAFQLKLLI